MSSTIIQISLQASKSHSSKAPKSEFFAHATPTGHDSATPMHTETASPITPKLQMTSTSTIQPSSQADRISTLVESLSQHIFRFERIHYSTNNQVQMRLKTIETVRCYSTKARGHPLAIRAKKGERQHTVRERATQEWEVCILKGGVVCSRRGSCYIHSHILLDS